VSVASARTWQPMKVEVEEQGVHLGGRVIKATMPGGPRNRLGAGT
jgi:hypothetical protein